MVDTGLDWLDLPAPERVEFERSPLALSLCQVSYASMLNVSSPPAVAPFQQAVLDDFPILTQEQEQNVKLQLQGDAALRHAAVQATAGSTAWRFADTEDNWTLVLTPEFVTLETRAYNSFPEFLGRLGRVLRALVKHIRPRVCTRIGLRYINEIRPAGLSWESVIRHEVLGLLAVPQVAALATQAVQHVRLNGPDGTTVNIQHGLLPEGSVVVPKGDADPQRTPFYVLDIDVYRQFAPNELPMKIDRICDRVERYHDAISLLFRWAVTEEYTSTLGRRADGVD